MRSLYFITLILAILGSINWGLIGAADIDLVKLIFGENTMATKITYSSVGLSGLYLIYHVFSKQVKKR